MGPVLALIAALSGPLFLAQPTATGVPPAPKVKRDAACEQTWAKAEKPAIAETTRCAKHFLQFGYGADWKADDLTLDPHYGDPIETDYSAADLKRMIGHVAALCPSRDLDKDAPCARAYEFFEGMLTRKMSLFEDVNLGSIEPVLKKVLAGEALTRADLYLDHEELRWSALTLRKLRNAAYARHGYQFKDADLNDFFYGPRSEPEAGLPLPKGEKKDVQLTPTDTANVQLIKSQEK